MKIIAKILGIAATVTAITACSSHDYTVTVNLPDNSLNGETVYIVNYDNGDTIASAVADTSKVVFSGVVEEPIAVNLRVGRARKLFILEPGNIVFKKNGMITGTPMNDQFDKFMSDLRETLMCTQTLMQDPALTEEQRDSLYDEMEATQASEMQKLYDANKNNPMGYLGFVSLISDMSVAQIDSALAEAPAGYGDYNRVKMILENAKNREATVEGKPFVDFEVTSEDGIVTKFSDFVGKGTPVLVDFWASWCGPCRAEIPNIKAIKEKYGDKIAILGVAVWDKADDTVRAIEELGITWPQIINAQSIPTDIYGIQGIPHIMIIGADGTIESRGLRGEELAAKVEEIVNK